MPSAKSNTPEPSVPDDVIDIQMGERRFTVCRSTLTDESTYFAALFSGNWAAKPLRDGAYFFDVDGDLFAYILRYMRHGTFPVFYDRKNGHRHAEYDTLRDQAQFFGLDALADWLTNRKYLQAVTIKHSVMSGEGTFENTTTADASVQILHSWENVKHYACPYNNPNHQEDPDRCGSNPSCRGMLSDLGVVSSFVEKKVLKIVCIKEETLWKDLAGKC